MAEKIKNFIKKKKLDAKFKLAGPGKKLTDPSESFVGPSKKSTPAAAKRDPTEASRQAAEAALARLSVNKKRDTAFNTSLASIQAQVRRELEAQNNQSTEPKRSGPIETNLDASKHLAVQGVYFKCPMVSEEVLSKDEWKIKIKEHLVEQLDEERGITACLMIHSCNYSRTKVKDCVDILCKYLENIINNPDEPKYHKIRCSNNTFRDKVLPICGAIELLQGAGFTKQDLDNNGQLEEFYVFNINNIEGIETLEFLRDALRSEDRIELELDRNLQVLSPNQACKRVDLPNDFYALTPEEIKREQQLKSEVVEQAMVLRTKAMREKDELREIRKYKFALIRVRFPDGLYLQGTFSVYEKFSEVVTFVRENLETETEHFILSSPTGHKFGSEEFESTLFDLRLVPATILTFQWENPNGQHTYGFLKPEVQILMQPI